MDRSELISALQQIKALAEQALKITGRRKTRHTKVQIAQSSKLASKKTLSGLLLRQRDAGFFKEAKTAKEVRSKLQTVYPCELNRVEVALFRLHKKKQLRKTSKIVEKKKQVAYVW